MFYQVRKSRAVRRVILEANKTLIMNHLTHLKIAISVISVIKIILIVDFVGWCY